MSGLGLLASAFAGGAQAINQQAVGDIDKQNRLDIAKEMSRIQEEANMRLAENQARLNREGNKNAMVDARDFNSSDETIAASGKVADAKSATDRRSALATATDETLNSAQRKKASDDRAATHDTQVRETIADAANSSLLAATGKIKLADPEVAARIAASRAAAGANAAHSGLLAQQAASLELDVKDKEKLNGLYDDASRILSNPELTDEARGKQFGDVQKKISMMKSKTGQARDPELDTVTTKTKKLNPDGTEIETTEKSIRRPGGDGSSGKAPYPDGTELKNKDGSIWVVKDGKPVPKGQAVEKPAAKTDGGMIGFTPSPWVDPTDSPAGKQKARNEAAQAAQASALATRQQEAGAAFDALAGGDAQAAGDLQRSPLFQYLTPVQKRQVFNTVNGRGN